MTVADLSQITGRTYPARRRTQNLVGGMSPIQATNFSMGHVTLEPNGGQVPWHNQEQEEIYFIVEGTGEMCLGEERTTLSTGQAVSIPPGVFHQLTNIGSTPLRMIYCYGPCADRFSKSWRREGLRRRMETGSCRGQCWSAATPASWKHWLGKTVTCLGR